MKKIIFITILSVLFTIVLSSCTKDESEISGQIIYTGAISPEFDS